MLTIALYLYSLLHLLSSTAATTPPYTPTDYFLLNCGSSSNATSQDGRSWDGDATSTFSPSNIGTTSSPSTATQQDPSATGIPFLTARIFTSKFTYTFPVSSGPKFIRLYFYPATYPNFDRSKSYFSVTTANYTLLTNFSAFLTVSALGAQHYTLIKEFIVNVRDTQKLHITFNPSPNSYAFINGIEVVSIPNNFYMKGDGIPLVGSQQSFYIDKNTALETLYRLNVGGKDLSVNDDTGMYRTWHQDDPYIYNGGVSLVPHLEVPIRYTNETPNYTAPATVYTTARTMGKEPLINLQYNLTWIFTVDSGFQYLARLHFCEFLPHMTQENDRIFSVYMNNQTADQEVDVIHLSGGNGIPVFKDYVLLVPAVDGLRKVDLWLAMHPNMHSKPMYADAILNGLEIFKLNQSNGSLAGPNPAYVMVPAQRAPYPKLQGKQNSKTSSLVAAVAGGVIGGVFLISVIGFLIFRRRRRVRDSGASVVKSSWVQFFISHASKSTKTNASMLPSNLCRHFSLAELKSATLDFKKDFVIGTGGFGYVYKGYIDNGTSTVAIKRLHPSSSQGAREFRTEIEMLSKLRHRHLVALIGYCDDDGEMILVYDYMANGTLRDHLYKSNNPPLPWKQRLEICIGAARGLHYLHTGAKHMIIHRDVKSVNILLDEKWVAKFSDFGLSKIGPTNVTKSHVSTVVKGSFGYMDPEYYRRQQLTEKSDVYSFGVVLLEVLCGRPAIVTGLEKEQVSLAEWGRKCWREGTVDQIVDPHLTGQIVSDCLKKFGEIFESCLRDTGIERPAMGDVIWHLEFALQLQEIAERNINCEDGLMSPSDPLLQARKTTTDDDDDMLFSTSQSNGTETSTAESGARSGNSFGSHQTVVFSEIMNPNGRNKTSNVEEDLSEPEESEVGEGSVPGKVFNSAELHSYISPKPNRINEKKNFLGLEAINPSIGLGCVGMASNIDRFMTYKMYSTSPGDWDLAQKLVVSGSEFTIDEVLSLKPGKIRVGLDFSPATGAFAAIMREKNATVALARLNLGEPFNEVIALRGLLPLYVSIGSRLPFFDSTLDIVHSTPFLDGWIGIELLQFVLFDWDRVLWPKGILWVDWFFCKKEDMNMYLNEFTRLGYQKLLWRVVPKTDKDSDEMFFSAVLEKPARL
ncbi:hypothetical protein HYC85_003136 [Camellia sinensis]|uniref:Protein kinase domain-containing protein n=1 Tax=Camellia sinensis TaxID=4442 RepID=A0A7J7IBG6_CAMSI|nr:hypothetical protein HYC85_003136 [Camellia sinensis]